MSNVPTRRPPRVTHSEDNGTDNPLTFVGRTPRYGWGDWAFMGVLFGSLVGGIGYGLYAVVGWVRGLR